ncbi:FAD-dependent oxidoreductase [Lutimaribacter sp. EGI FJ00015]|uniref:FAD-dependent oxidoreductase n=1 Tax=Lutimaribacter degradans TaxID=2945989 RepID=A0ACC5ZZG3_9RHOB|nr:FAD-dependent oxidoreductase [Lutimaribacter sp. EGI FJ00013]MCM2562929.1 FAD-dependent oxidoreductase [Lutimaribacter sp. EGI FJ00013]MCO0614097.1 FAD-dependent oxidoreductase [Lutimaribacter sp. EGI FJ00015]MCO0636074.1 FAD-dependent oxidoreductase [Lutimaribacter sp. EGI FJ00014]
MPFEAGPVAPKKIAVIGAGIAGMGAAHMLSAHHDVTLIEAEPRLGGHARTIIAGKNGDQPVDTGFIVFNYANYPHLAALFAELDVPVTKSNMSFGASLKGGTLEYGLASLGALFAQTRNMANPRFLRMIRDVMHFNANALSESQDRSLSIADFLEKMGTGDWFRDYYLLPLSGAIWSTPVEKIMDFPAHAMVQFFENHALLHHSGQHQWFTVEGGSVSYVTRIEAAMRARGVRICLGSPVEAVRRTTLGAEVKLPGTEWEAFDDVVFATHSDDTLRLLADPSSQERAGLGAIAYQPNDIVLHADVSIMPKRRKVWSSWNYIETADKQCDKIDLTYWMNSLQPIPQDDPHFVTLNSTRPIREDLIYDTVTLRHPVYDLAALQAQKDIAAMNGTRNTWFCGAWMKHGFHEDGLSSAVDVVEAIAKRSTVAMAAE